MEDKPCLVQASTSPTSPRALPASRIFLSPGSNTEAATTRRAVAPAVPAALDAAGVQALGQGQVGQIDAEAATAVHHPYAIAELRATLVIPYTSTARPYIPRRP